MKKPCSKWLAFLLTALLPLIAQAESKSVEPKNLSLKIISKVPAWDSVVYGNQIITLDEDFLHISATSLTSGKRLWKRKFQKKAIGIHRLYLAGKRLFVYAGNQLYTFNARSGKRVAVYDVPSQQGRNNPGGCYLDTQAATCAINCDCQFQFCSCADGAVLGPKYSLSYTCMEDDTFGPSSGCFGPQGQPLGQAGELWLATVENPKSDERHGFAGPQMVVAVNPRSGQEVWRSQEAVLSYWVRDLSGISSDGRVCWLGNLDGALKVFACQTGQLLWQQKSSGPKSSGDTLPTLVAWVEKPKGLYVIRPGQAGLYAADTGQARWEIKLDAKNYTLPRGVSLSLVEERRKDPAWKVGYSHICGPLEFALLDPASGKVQKSIKIEGQTCLLSDRQGGLFSVGNKLISYSDKLEITWQMDWLGKNIVATGAKLLVANDGKELTIVDRLKRRVYANFKGSFSVLEVKANRLVVFKHNKTGQGEVWLIKTDKSD
ncbi:MAG: PQQ-binding-like beta-propeller repeat protein [Deltaproteobacteria bacterium]|nr:PQQ-binding-like beta-propeller repeat protein [Deltaproteobacteria bacterium]